MAHDALQVTRYDLLGFSLGGFIAQEIALRRPWAVRRLVLAGTGPRAAGTRPAMERHFLRRNEVSSRSNMAPPRSTRS